MDACWILARYVVFMDVPVDEVGFLFLWPCWTMWVMGMNEFLAGPCGHDLF